MRVLVLMTYESDTDILRAVEAGAAGYLLKDTRREELIEAVRGVARGETVLARGGSNSQIGTELFITEATVKTHLIRVFTKLGDGDRTRAVTVALERGLLPSS